MFNKIAILACWALLFLYSCGDAFSNDSQEELPPATSMKMFMPENEMHLEDGLGLLNNQIDEGMFHRILDHVYSVYSPIFRKVGRRLIIERDWYDSTVNAYAYQRGSYNYIKMFGGLARRYEITPAGFALVACHEIGHHLGGFPLYDGYSWATNEGGSDYYATQVCAKRIWADLEDNTPVSSYVMSKCDSAHRYSRYRRICYMAAAAGLSAAKLFSSRGQRISFQTPDRSRVSRTYDSHPASQCRLDTYFQGALCFVGRDDKVIPRTESKAYLYSCSRYYQHTVGLRPLCWYRPRLVR